MSACLGSMSDLQTKNKDISDFMKLLMSLPHSSASAERNFSKLKIFVFPLRNKLLPKTVKSLFHVTRFIPDVAEWNIETSLVNDAKNWKPKNKAFKDEKFISSLDGTSRL